MLHSLIVRVKQPFLKLVPIATPKCWVGEGKSTQIDQFLQDEYCQNPLIITDSVLLNLGLLKPMLASLDAANINYQIFSEVTPDPDFEMVRLGTSKYTSGRHDSLIAFGGGSVIDCGKAIIASAGTKKDISKLTGILKVHKRLPKMIAIPTTAGTGSEATIAAVVSDVNNKQKLAITDPSLVPDLAVLDASLMLGLPAKITAETGIDALTHAIESFVSLYANSETKNLSIDAIVKIFKHLPIAYADGSKKESRQELAVASYQAGLAFTRTYIGYVHAIAHQLGAFYHIPHGLANAMVLPKILEFSFESCIDSFATMARAIGCANKEHDNKSAAKLFLAAVNDLLSTVAIPSKIKQLQQNDINELAKRAINEALYEYPVPKVMSVAQCEKILTSLLADKSL